MENIVGRKTCFYFYIFVQYVRSTHGRKIDTPVKVVPRNTGTYYSVQSTDVNADSVLYKDTTRDQPAIEL